MLMNELPIKIISLNKRFATTENPSDSLPHKSYTEKINVTLKPL